MAVLADRALQNFARQAPSLEHVQFSDRIELRALSVARDGERLTLRLWWKPLPSLTEHDWIFFIHSIDDSGNIVLNNQIVLSSSKQASQDGSIQFDTISFDAAPASKSSRLAVGFYRPQGDKLLADRGNRDWFGARVIVSIPAS